MKHHSALQFAWLLNMCLRGTLFASLNHSIVFFLFFFIMYPKSFLSQRASALVYLHHRSLLFLTMEKMCFATTFTQWEGSARKDGLGVSVWSFPFHDLRTWPRAPLDGCLSTSRIVLSLSLTMTSMIKKRFKKASSTIFRIAYHVPPICFEPEGICFGAPASQIPTFANDGEDVFYNYLHAMGGVRKEGWLGDFCMKLSFWWLKNLTSGIFV